MKIFSVMLSALMSVTALFLLTRLLGKRQVSQLSFFDYINGITIGSIAAEFAIATGKDRWAPLAAMLVYAAVVWLMSYVTCKSIKLRRFIEGRPVILYENGRIYEQNLLNSKLDVNEFLTNCRAQGFFDLGDIECAVLEINGAVSILPKSGRRPATPDDLGLCVKPEKMCANVIIDGEVLLQNLRHSGHSPQWLAHELEKQATQAQDVVLGTVDSEGTLYLCRRTGKQVKRDLFI